MQVFKQTNFTKTPIAFVRFVVVGIFSFCILNATIAQKQTVKGVVKDNNGELLIGVSVLIKGTTNGTITNYNGQYAVDVNSGKDVLLFSYVGYNNFETVVGNLTNIDVILTEDTKALDEIVVVGYGTQKKSDLTGSVVSVKADDMNAIPTTSVAEMLRGQAAGVVVTQNSARPGGGSDIVIRGKKSLTGGNSPLYIVDGVPVTGIDDYNSQDILSVEVLKDASTQAIYGARASNGVILITTKKGQQNKTSVDFSTYAGSQVLKRNFDFFNPEEWIQLKREANRVYTIQPDGTYSTAYLGGDPVDGVYPGDASLFGNMYQNVVDKKYTDWEKLAVSPALQQKYDLSVRSGGPTTKLSASLGYFDQKGMIAPASYQRANFRFNVEQKLSKKLTFGINSNYTYSYRNAEDETFSKFITESPLFNPFDASGNLVPVLEDSKYNPLWNNKNQLNNTTTKNFLLNTTLDWEILKGLKYRLNASLNNRNSTQGTYLNTKHEKGMAVLGLASISTSDFTDYLLENILTFDQKINDDNKLDITLVQSTNLQLTENNEMTGSGFVSDDLGYDFISSAAKLYPPRHNIEPRNLLSYMGRLRYNLMEKYLFSASARIDGSSVFGVNNKWGLFPAGSFAWRASEEDFLKEQAWLSNLKVRLSYGSVGNQGVDPYQSQVLANSYYFQFGTGDPFVGYLPGSQLPNPDLKWETTTSFNGGVDFSILKDRIGGTIEYYHSITSDLLMERSINQTTGYTSQLVNIGKVQNKGIEVTFNFVPVKTKDFTWNVDVNFSANQNKILELNGAVDVDGKPVNDLANGWFIGHNIDAYNYQQFDGIWQTGDVIPEYKGTYKPKAGDIRVKDINNDTIINDLDKVIMDRAPKWTGALSSTLKWKGIEFSFDIYTVQGALRSNPFLYDANSGGSLTAALNGIKVDYWTLENPSNTAPRPRQGTNDYIQSLAYQDASYIRLRNLSLGYSFPKKLINDLKMNNLRIYATATNLWTQTKFLSYSPEASASAYPEPKTFVVGLNVSF
jgi:TonB-linked SusC/RagA family outer membrane protein